ncbi:sulfatase family protein [Ereboglobus luteus]|nr:sulfatase [Ereboglobus luteus]
MKKSVRASLPVISTLAAIATVAPDIAQAAAPPPSSRPNVVIFITDDESWLERSAYGWSNLPTPHFDRVARKGALFTRCYTSAPSCAPSRASLLTGRNFWELEQGAFIQAWLPKKFPLLPDLLADAGYHTGYTGKGWGPGIPPPGVSKRDYRNPAGKACNNIKRPKEERSPGMSDFDYAANFEAFLKKRPAGTPFYFWVGCVEPHHPIDPNNHKHLETRHGIKPDDIKMPGFQTDKPESRRERAGIWHELCRADDDLGRILDTLEQSGELDNTIIIVTGDNGTAIPLSKASPYDWGVHEPLAIMWPARMKAARRVDDFVNFADFAPTILEAAGVPVPESMSGRSILPLLLSEKSGRIDSTRSFTVTGLEWHGQMPPYNSAARAIRDERYQYIINYGIRPPSATPPNRGAPTSLKPGETWEELYDCEADPWQQTNLAASPAHAETKARLKKQMRDYQLKTRDPRATGNMEIFNQTRALVETRKKNNYKDAHAP